MNFQFKLIESGVSEQSAPWWGVSVVAGLFLLLGGLLSFLSTRLNQKYLQKQSERIRWDNDIRELSSELISLSQTLITHLTLRNSYEAGATAGFEAAKLSIVGDKDAILQSQHLAEKEKEFFRKKPNEDIFHEKTENMLRLFAIQANLSFISPMLVQEASDGLVAAVVDFVNNKKTNHERHLLEKIYTAQGELTVRVRTYLGVG